MKITEELIRNIFNNPEDNSEFAGEYDYNYPGESLDWNYDVNGPGDVYAHAATDIGLRYIDGDIEYNLTSQIELEGVDFECYDDESVEDEDRECYEVTSVEICGDARFHWFELQAYNTKTKEVENETFQLEDLKLPKKKEQNLITFVDNKINELIYGYDGN